MIDIMIWILEWLTVNLDYYKALESSPRFWIVVMFVMGGLVGASYRYWGPMAGHIKLYFILAIFGAGGIAWYLLIYGGSLP